MIKSAIVSGYATIDYVLNVDASFSGDNIAPMQPIDRKSWERPGAATFYTSAQLAEKGIDVYPVTWIGDDKEGDMYWQACRDSNLQLEAINRLEGVATPSCILIYRPDGSQGVLLNDSGMNSTTTLTGGQISAIRKADLVCLSGAPESQTDTVLLNTSDDAIVVWIAKEDEKSFPNSLRRRISERANIIFCNQSERAFVNNSFKTDRSSDVTIIETRGAGGVMIETNENTSQVNVEKIQTGDTTGAGDTFAGATLGALLTQNISMIEADRKSVV